MSSRKKRKPRWLGSTGAAFRNGDYRLNDSEGAGFVKTNKSPKAIARLQTSAKGREGTCWLLSKSRHGRGR